MAARRAEIDRQFRDRLVAVAAKYDELSLPKQAAATRGWFIDRDAPRQYLFLPPAKDALQPPAAAPQVVRFWYERFSRYRREHADRLFELADQYAASGDVTTAYRLLHELLRENPDHARARRILGYTKSGAGLWRRTEGQPRAKRMTVANRRLSWQARSYWRVDSAHFRISTNDSAEAGREMAAELETLYDLWRQVFVPYWLDGAALKRAFAGGALPAPSKRKHLVVLFGSRDEYIAYLQRENPRVEVSHGLYSPEEKTAFFYSEDEPARSTWHHEATHQLFQETGLVAGDVAAEHNTWIVEGVAQYMESLAEHDGYYSVGGVDAYRLQFARFLLLGQDYYRPLEQLVALGRLELQRDADIGRLYWQSAGLAHFLMDYDGGKYRRALDEYLKLVYQGRAGEASLAEVAAVELGRLDSQYRDWLQVTDDDLAYLNPSPHVRRLHLSNTAVTDNGLARLGQHPELEFLDLAGTAVSDRGMAHLRGLENLTVLWLAGTRVGDAALEHLWGLKKLQQIDLRQTAVTPDGIERLKQALPAVELVE